MKRAISLFLTLLLALSCRNQGRLQNGDLIFVGLPMDYVAQAGSMDEAISSATGQEGPLNLIHVAIAEVKADSVWIIDATIAHGVDRHPLDTFLRDFTLRDGSYPTFVVKRVKGVDADAAVQRAKSFCGREYDVRFLPDNEELYCSELVQKSYLDANGNPVFKSGPMNFKAPDGTMPPYWEWLFSKLGMEVPQGLPGTNPQDMSHADCLQFVWQGDSFYRQVNEVPRERELHSEADLSGLTLSTSAGNFYDDKYSGREDITMFRVNSEADGIQALRQGIADVHVTDEVAFTPEMRRELGIKLAFRGEERFDVAFAVRKGNDELREQMNRFILESRASGKLDAVLAHWLEGTPAPETDRGEISEDATPLRCVTAINMAPVCYVGEGGVWMGMDADILQRFAAWSGRPFEMKFQDFGAAMIALSTGQCDVVNACLYVTEERKQSVDFTEPYYLCRGGYFVIDKEDAAVIGFGDRLRNNLTTEGRWRLITDGLWITLVITVFSILLGTMLGAGVCAMLRSRRKWVRKTVEVYGALIQGIPTLVLLLIMFYVVLAGAGLSGTLVAIITFALCFAWSSGSIFSSAISSVPKGQTEAGLSLGFTPIRTFTGIVFPQALQKALPLYTGECVALLKSTSIVGYIAIMDLTRASDLIRSRTFDALVPLLVVTIAYFVLAWLIRLLFNLFLKK